MIEAQEMKTIQAVEVKEVFEDYLTYCKDYTIDGLMDKLGYIEQVYMCDLANDLTMSINIGGSATYSSYKAQQYLKKWWNEASKVYMYQKDNFGDVLHNPFENPEAFHVCMIIHGVENILSQCPTIARYYNEQRALTDALIDKIIQEIKEVTEISF